VKLADKGLGITFIPELNAINNLSNAQRGNLHYLEKQQPVRQISLVLRRSYLKRKIIEVLEKSIKDNLPEEISTTKGKIFLPL
jgi:LysR family hydrogen peroxide-inducible transcriptional activator